MLSLQKKINGFLRKQKYKIKNELKTAESRKKSETDTKAFISKLPNSALGKV